MQVSTNGSELPTFCEAFCILLVGSAAYTPLLPASHLLRGVDVICALGVRWIRMARTLPRPTRVPRWQHRWVNRLPSEGNPAACLRGSVRASRPSHMMWQQGALGQNLIYDSPRSYLPFALSPRHSLTRWCHPDYRIARDRLICFSTTYQPPVSGLCFLRHGAQ